VSLATPSKPVTIHAPDEIRRLSARRIGPRARFAELWSSRRLVLWFGRRFIERMYANTLLGWWWVPLRPLLSIVPRAVVFGGILKAPSNGAPYLLFFLVGVAVWGIVDRGWYFGTRSLQVSARYLKRMYIPRLAPLMASVAPALTEFVLYTVFGALVVAYYTVFRDGFPLDLGLNTLLFPPAVLITCAIVLSLSSWTSIFGAHGRDARWTVRAVLHFWMLFTPVIYPLSAVPEKFKTIAELNPMTAPMEMARKAVFNTGDVTTLSVAVSLGFILVVGTLGLMFFSRSGATALDYL
jgi:lipopolysaccharide transport system permease protein